MAESLPTGENGRDRSRVLIVDDNADLRKYLSALLEEDYDITVACDGAEALEQLRGDLQVHIVLSDVMMPRLDGMGLIRALRADPKTASLPVILVSARADEGAIEGLDAGADDYIIKPFSAKELLARVRTHVQLARTRQKWIADLERANKELDAFAYSVSHDLRAPLRAIRGFAEILRVEHGETLDSDALAVLQHIESAGRRMTDLIEGLLKFSRLSRQPLTRTTVNLDDVVSAVVSELPREDGREVDLRIAALPPVIADPALLRQVFANLLSNAYKFTRNRKPAVIEVMAAKQNGDVQITVRDNGTGFDMRYADKLFGVFQRLHDEREFPGTGVGLSLVQRIVQRHGGRVWAEAEPDRGATFHFTLPDHP